MSDDIEICADLIRRGDPDRFLGIMSAPVRDRAALFVIYAFNLEIVRAPWVTQEPMIAEMRLQWWLDAIEEIYQGKPSRRHNVVTPLADLISKRNLPIELFQDLIKARRWDIYKEPHAHAFAFEDYIMATSGNLMGLACLSVGMDVTDLDAAKDYGYGDGIARLFLAIPELENMQRYPLVDGRKEAVQALAQNALDRMGFAKFAGKEAYPSLRMAWLAKPILARVFKTPELVSRGDVSPTEFSKKIRLLYKSFRKSF